MNYQNWLGAYFHDTGLLYSIDCQNSIKSSFTKKKKAKHIFCIMHLKYYAYKRHRVFAGLCFLSVFSLQDNCKYLSL